MTRQLVDKKEHTHRDIQIWHGCYFYCKDILIFLFFMVIEFLVAAEDRDMVDLIAMNWQ